jgi:hypothetical protein
MLQIGKGALTTGLVVLPAGAQAQANIDPVPGNPPAGHADPDRPCRRLSELLDTRGHRGLEL